MILTVSLSPAWQRTLLFKDFHEGHVNRAIRVIESAAGKGVNVARVVNTLGLPVCLLTVAGGQRGRLFRHELVSEGISTHVVSIKGETRLCQTIVTSGAVTEVVEESAELSHREQSAFLTAFTSAVKRASMVVLSGSVPHSCGDSFMAELAGIGNRWGVPVMADTQRVQLLRLMKARPVLVKINREELAAATGQGSLKRGAHELMKLGANSVVISDGARAVTVFSGGGNWKILPPRIKALNPIGSGDAMMAGIAAGLAQGQSLDAAVNLGVACGASNALTETPGAVNLRTIKRLMRAFNLVTQQA